MPAMVPPLCDFGWKAPDFSLPDADGNAVALADVRGATGTLVMFICNHCPYVRAVADRIARDARDLRKLGIGVVAIMPNDYARYPDDAPDKMKAFAAAQGFGFPYLVDKSQEVARAYDAICTPDFFGFTPISSCGTAAGSTNRATRPPRPMSAATCTRRSRRSRAPGPAPASRPRAWGVRSSGANDRTAWAPNCIGWRLRIRWRIRWRMSQRLRFHWSFSGSWHGRTGTRRPSSRDR